VKTALVHDWLTGQRGGEKVLEVLAEVFPKAPIYTLFHFKGSQHEDIERRVIRTSFLQGMPFLRKKYRSYLPLFPLAVEIVNRSCLVFMCCQGCFSGEIRVMKLVSMYLHAAC
jgi:hypothetical protein